MNRLKSLKESDVDFKDIECYIPELSKHELNGRQIRNAITIARQLAKFKGGTMSYKHLKHVIKVAGQFDSYLSKTKEGLNDVDLARASGFRW